MKAVVAVEKNVLRAVQAIVGVREHFDVWNLAGDHNARLRVAVMSALKGEKVPRAKAGVNAISAALFAEAGIGFGHGCLANREDALAEWAYALIAKAKEGAR